MTEVELRTAELNRKIEVLNTAIIGLEAVVDYCLEAKLSTKVLASKIKAYIQQTNAKLAKEYRLLPGKLAELKLCGKLYDVIDKQTRTCLEFKPCKKYHGHDGACGPKGSKAETSMAEM